MHAAAISIYACIHACMHGQKEKNQYIHSGCVLRKSHSYIVESYNTHTHTHSVARALCAEEEEEEEK